MEECELSPAGRDHPWKAATLRRMAWAQSRDSWASPESDQPQNNNNNQTETTTETGPIPNKITSWLRECRTPLGASLDEQASSPSRGPQRNGCSFEDDLSLGAEAHLLQRSSAKPDPSNYEMQAMEKRSQFRQKGRSMNSTGSGKSSGTSVSELLDRYEEDPEEILYNLGFGREEPDIASKIPPRFFNTSSNAKGIDVTVYLGAQMQRMELENPNYALTSRFRQTEVLATVADAFSAIYSQVSGRPLQQICSNETETKEFAPLQNHSSTLSAVKKLKKKLTRPNLMALSEIMSKQPKLSTNSDPDGSKSDVSHPPSESESKEKFFRTKDPTLPKVNEEPNQCTVVCDSETEKSKPISGELSCPSVPEKSEVIPDVLDTSKSDKEQNNGEVAESESSPIPDKQKTVSSSSIPDKESCSFLPNPHMAHLLSQPRDSFEMEELQINEDEVVSGTNCYPKEGSESLLRTASQQSDSSGFAEDPSTEGSANILKVLESSDSCDSETTVTPRMVGPETPVSLEHPEFDRLFVDDELQGMELFGSIGAEDFPDHVSQRGPRNCIMDNTKPETLEAAGSEVEVQDGLTDSVIETGSSTESLSTVESANPESPSDMASVPNVPNAGAETTVLGEQGMIMETDCSTETIITSPSISSTVLEPVVENEQSTDPVPESKVHEEDDSSTLILVCDALHRAEQRTCEGQRGRVWTRSRDLLRNVDVKVRNPFQRSSSLPTSLLSPTRVVSSVHIQLGQGSVQKCTPPSYRYHYEKEAEEVASVADDVDGDLNPDIEPDSTGVPPYPMNVPQHLTRSTSSLYSIPADWPLRRVAETPIWSTSSVPDLTQYTRIPHSAIPRHIQQEIPQFRGQVRSPSQKPLTPPSQGYTPISSPFPYTQSGLYSHYPQPQNPPFPHPVYTPQHGSPLPQQNMAYPQSMPYNASAAFQGPPLTNPYGSSFNLHMQGNPYHPHMPLNHAYSAPYSMAYGNTPYHLTMPFGHQCNSPFHTPPAPFSPVSSFPSNTPMALPNMGTVEMQLRQVLHEIRGAVQSLGQTSSEQRDGTPSGVHSPHQAAQTHYEELQRRRRNLNVFRSQMMDLELTLMRQQAMVYQLLTPEERREAEQLQRLRVAVRQELQDLELQLEDRLLSLDDQFHSARTSHLYRHQQDMSRGHSMDSLTSSSALRATEPVTDLLREQMYLQSELSDDGCGVVDTPFSAHSSRSASPVRFRDPADVTSPLSRRKAAVVYRSTVSLTPSIPPRLGSESHERTTTPDTSTSLPERATYSTTIQNEPSFQEGRREGGGGGGGGGEEVSGNMQQLIQQIKQSLTDEIRKEIVNELLAVVLPQRSPVVTQEPAP